MPHAEDSKSFYVMGSEMVYLVTLDPPSCECKGFAFRGHCSHLEAVLNDRRQKDPCPVCRGRAVHVGNGSVVYVDVKTGQPERRELPLSCCGGAGTKEAWIAGGRVGTIATSGLSEAARRDLFR